MVPQRAAWCGLLLAAILVRLAAQTPTGEVRVDEAEPFVSSWAAPERPAGWPRDQPTPDVVVEFAVSATGEVIDAKAEPTAEPALAEAAEAAVRQWKFEPAISGGRPVACALRVPVRFASRSSRQQVSWIPPQPLPRTSPTVKRWGHLAMPEIGDRRKLGGAVIIEFTVNPEGRAESPRVVAADAPDLVRPALAALAQTEFEPARQGRLLTVPAQMQAPFEFDPATGDRLEQWSANGISPAEGESISRFKIVPVPITYCDPVYPHALILTGQRGEAAVAFTVTPAGRVRNVSVLDATAPEFGAALAAAVRHWAFRPGQTSEGKDEARLVMRHHFEPPVAAEKHPVGRLVQRLQPDGEGVAGAKGLDHPLVPLYRVGPQIAELALAGASEARIEFIVDREGRARLPRVLKSSSDEFGWAAATAVSQWVFEPPLRQGEAVDVRVIIPINHR